MSSTRKVPAQGTIFCLIGGMISNCCFFPFFISKVFQTDWFGAGFQSLLVGRLIAPGDGCIKAQRVSFLTVISIDL